MENLYHLQCGSKEKVGGSAMQMKPRIFLFEVYFCLVTGCVIIAKTGSVHSADTLHMQQNRPVSGIMNYAVLEVELQ